MYILQFSDFPVICNYVVYVMAFSSISSWPSSETCWLKYRQITRSFWNIMRQCKSRWGGLLFGQLVLSVTHYEYNTILVDIFWCAITCNKSAGGPGCYWWDVPSMLLTQSLYSVWSWAGILELHNMHTHTITPWQSMDTM